MADFSVKVVKINKVEKLENSDRLSVAYIDGWQCVIQRDSYREGDLAIYIPIDSILPQAVEEKLFGADAKIKLSKSRVRTIKIRGAISQGMLAPCAELGVPEQEGYDCTAMLGITKFEPPEPPANMRSGANPVSKKKKNPNFKEYGGLDNFKHHNRLFQDGEPVVITEKIHGTNFRAGIVPVEVNTLLKKVQRALGILKPYEFVYGSNKVQLQHRLDSGSKWKIKLFGWIPIKSVRTLCYQGYYAQSGVGNVYAEAVVKYSLKTRLKEGEVLYGEVYGDGIQKNYAYGCKQGEHKLIVFDLMRDGEYVSHDELVAWCKDRGLDMVPVLYRGPFAEATARDLTKGNSVLEPTQKVREGVVIRPEIETRCHIGRKVLKLISDEYLLKDDNTDFH
jgi:RNA ligase (TIGR02306 family)